VEISLKFESCYCHIGGRRREETDIIYSQYQDGESVNNLPKVIDMRLRTAGTALQSIVRSGILRMLHLVMSDLENSSHTETLNYQKQITVFPPNDEQNKPPHPPSTYHKQKKKHKTGRSQIPESLILD
jgi:hypothetical protein